jgi:hypothetical protein
MWDNITCYRASGFLYSTTRADCENDSAHESGKRRGGGKPFLAAVDGSALHRMAHSQASESGALKPLAVGSWQLYTVYSMSPAVYKYLKGAHGSGSPGGRGSHEQEPRNLWRLDPARRPDFLQAWPHSAQRRGKTLRWPRAGAHCTYRSVQTLGMRAVTWKDGVEASEGGRGFETTIRSGRCIGPSCPGTEHQCQAPSADSPGRAQQACVQSGVRVCERASTPSRVQCRCPCGHERLSSDRSAAAGLCSE